MSCARHGSLGVGMKQIGPEKELLSTVVPMDEIPPHAHLTVPEIEKMIRSKIGTSTRSFTVQKQKVYQMFGRPTNGIKRNQFKKRLQNWGIMPTKQHIDAIFDKWDADGNGTIDYNEFMAQMLAKDYDINDDGKTSAADMFRGFSEPASTTFNDVMLAAVGQRKVKRPDEETMYSQIDRAREKAGTLAGQKRDYGRAAAGGGGGADEYDIDEVEAMISDKIMCHSRGDNVEKASSYAMFGRPERGITKRAFKFKLNQWGVHLHPRALEMLFQKYDADGSGRIDFLEFMKAFGGEGKAHPISMGEFELKQQAKAKAEAEASFGGVKKPGSRRSSKSKSKSKVKKKVPKHLRNNYSDADSLFGGAPGGGNRNPFGGGGPESRVKSGGSLHASGKSAEIAAKAAAGVAEESKRNRSRACQKAPRTVRNAQRKVWQAAEALAYAESGATGANKSQTRDLLRRKLDQFSSNSNAGNKGGGSRRGSRAAEPQQSLSDDGLNRMLERGLGLKLPYYQWLRLRDHYKMEKDVAGTRLVQDAEAIEDSSAGNPPPRPRRASRASSRRPTTSAPGTSRSRQELAWQHSRAQLANASAAAATAERLLRGDGKPAGKRPSTSKAAPSSGDAIDAAVAAVQRQKQQALTPGSGSVQDRVMRASARNRLAAKLDAGVTPRGQGR